MSTGTANRYAAGMANAATTAPESLATLGQRRIDLLEELAQVRRELAEAIAEASAQGSRQVDIVRATGYTREQIRLILAGRTR